jgi:gliding motility-associated-like protein
VANPTWNYSTTGTFTVTLIVTSSSGCTDTITQVVNPANSNTASFTNTTVCVGTATSFTDTSPGGTNWHWNFGDPASGPLDSTQTQNPTHVFGSPGTYVVTLTVGTSPCTSTITNNVIVNALPVAAFSYMQVCNSQTVNFTNTSTVTAPATITSTSWNFGDPPSGGNNTSALANPVHVFSAAGTYTVTLVATSSTGCPQTITQVITVGIPPTSAFTAPTVCVNTPMQFTNNSVAAGTYHWDFGDASITNDTSNITNPAYTYTVAGTYVVTLIANPGPCADTSTVTVTVAPLPSVTFIGTSVCLGSSTSFTDQSTIASGTIVGWHWDFGDAALTNDTSNIQNPSFTYAATGTYTVTLTCTSSNGCTSTNTITVTVNPQPTPAFVYLQVCSGQNVNFTSTSTVANPSTITSTSWDFGDPASGGNNVSALSNPSHTFTAVGTYTVTITVTTNGGCTQSTTQVINVLPPPTSAFTATTVCTNSPMSFTNQSVNAVSSHWDFGVAALSNDTSNLTNPTYTYTTAGTYTVMLISNPGTCADTATLSVTVAPGPQVQFIAPSVCLGANTVFTDQSTISVGSITNWSWDFGVAALSNDTSNLTNPNYTYNSSGTFTVTLTCTSNNGCTTTNTLPVTVNALPVANFSSTTVCQGTPTTFTDLSAANITSWSWDFGDGSPLGNTQNPTHVYANDSTYNVTLIVTNANGCIDTISLAAITASQPNVVFTADTFAGCPALCVNFIDQSTIASGTISAWSWDFGDNSPFSTQQNPSHCYTNTGTYTVTMTAISNAGCVQTQTIPNMITVYPVPHASFTANPQVTTILNTNIQFTDLSSGNPITWQWSFGDPTTTSDSSSMQNPSYFYSSEYGDTYNVNLIVTNQYGCVDDTTVEVIVEPEFTFFIPNAFTPNGDGVNDFFFGTGIGITKYQIWIFDRWGNLIFTSNDINEGWDGSVQGKGGDICQIDTYVWKVALTDVFDKRHKYIGKVSIIK